MGAGAFLFKSREKSFQFEAFTLLAETVMEGVRIFVVCHHPGGTNKISPG